jgi:serine/threonine-protein kinase
MIIGTPSYMSPEQCLGRAVSAASDQYALGIVAYELLAGHPPFNGASLAVLQQHLSEPIAPLLHALAPDCPPEMLAALERMLAKDPAERWPSVTQAVSALGGGLLAEDDPLRETLAQLARPVAPAPTPTTVRVTLSTPELEIGDVAVASAEVLDEHGAPLAAPGVAWSAEPPELVMAEAETGQLIGRAAGRAHIRATAGSARGEAVLDVVPPAPAAVTIAPPAAPLRVGDRWRPGITILDRRGGTLDAPATVEPLDASRVTITETGEVEAIESGAGGVRVRVGALVHDVPFHIEPAAVASLEIDPPPEPLLVGDRFRCAAVARDIRGRPLPQERVAWHVSDPARATVDADGTVTLRSAGEVMVHAMARECRATLTLHVRPAPVARVALVAPPAVLQHGERARLGARVWDARGNVLSRPVHWASSDAAILDVGPDGTVEARSPGTAVVTARCEEVEDSAEIGVTGVAVTELFRPLPPLPLADAGPEAVPAAEPDEMARSGPVVEATDAGAPTGPPTPPLAPVDHVTLAHDIRPEIARERPATEGTVYMAAPRMADAPAEPRARAVRTRRPARLLVAGLSGAVLLGAGGWLLTRSGDDTDAPAGVTDGAPAASGPTTDALPVGGGTTVPPTPAESSVAGAPGPVTVTPPAASPPTGPASGRPIARGLPASPTGTPGAAAGRPRVRAPVDSAARPRDAAPQPGDATPVRTPPPVVAAPPPAPGTPTRPTTPPAPSVSAAAAAAAAAETEARAGIQRAVDAYVAGVRERSVEAMQRVYPSMPAAMRRNWDALFSMVRSVDARAASLEIQPSAADAGSALLSLRVSFPNPANRRECVQVTQLRLRLARGGGGWQISELTQLSATGSSGCG